MLLVHGGASPEATWSGLERLRRRWTLVYAFRRGFRPSPDPPGGHQDWAVDADDVGELLDNRPHLVAHSYGGVGAVLAAIRWPSHVRSLTLIEPALFLPRGDPLVERARRVGDEFLAHGLDMAPAELHEFLRMSGARVPEQGPLPEAVISGVLRAQGSRSPGDADPPLEQLRDAGVPSLVASGDHQPAAERMCDAVATAIGAERVIAPGAGHFVAAAPGFAERLEQFLLATSR